MYIDSQAELDSFVKRAKSAPVLAIDTEFMREKTYYAQLCLVQMATDDETVIIDPLADIDLHPLAELMEQQSIMKLFHAGYQDIEIIYHAIGSMPEPLFDTQVAAALLGHTQQIGYAPLVSAECGVQLKKADSFTDWSRRPLSNSQVRYAADDVIYLPRMYRQMREALIEKGRLDWLTDDFADMASVERCDPDPRQRYLRLKRISQLNPRQRSAAREVAAWREESARRRNIPRKWVMTDEQVVEACKREARGVDSLFMVRGLQGKLSTKDARAIVNALCKGLDAPKDQWPNESRSGRSESNVDEQLDLMNALVRLRSHQSGIAFQTLAGHSDLVDLARGHGEETELMRGWRREIVGNELVSLLKGEITLSLGPDGLKVTKA